MKVEIKLWHRAALLGLLCVGAIVYIASTARDETHLAKSALRTPRNETEAAYFHAVTSGLRILGFTPDEPGTIVIQSQSIYQARSAFLLMAYTFLQKVYNDPACDTIKTIRIYPYAYLSREDGSQTLGPFAELVLPREGADEIDWTPEFPDLIRFRHTLVRHGSLKLDPRSLP